MLLRNISKTSHNRKSAGNVLLLFYYRRQAYTTLFTQRDHFLSNTPFDNNNSDWTMQSYFFYRTLTSLTPPITLGASQQIKYNSKIIIITVIINTTASPKKLESLEKNMIHQITNAKIMFHAYLMCTWHCRHVFILMQQVS